jgi:hypothetical protein
MAEVDSIVQDPYYAMVSLHLAAARFERGTRTIRAEPLGMRVHRETGGAR